jgi:hypothetical protein
MLVDFTERDAASSGDRAVVRCHAGERERHRLDQSGHFVSRHRAELSGGRFLQKPDGRRRKVCGLAQKSRERLLAARPAERSCELLLRHLGPQIDDQLRLARLLNRLAQMLGQSINRAAFDAVMRDHGLAADGLAVMRQRDSLERLAGEALPEDIRPLNGETAIGRTQRSDIDLLFLENIRPSAIGTELRPARAAKRKHRHVRRMRNVFPIRPSENQRAVSVPALPAIAQPERDAARIKPPQPGAQQWRGFHVLWKNAPAGADEGRLAERFTEGTQIVRRKSFDRRTQILRGFTIAREKSLDHFTVSQI